MWAETETLFLSLINKQEPFLLLNTQYGKKLRSKQETLLLLSKDDAESQDAEDIK